MNNDFNDLLQDALDMPYEEKINLTKEAVDKLYNVLITNNKDEAMPDMLKIFGYFIKLDNIYNNYSDEHKYILMVNTLSEILINMQNKSKVSDELIGVYHNPVVSKVIAYINENIKKNITLTDICNDLNFSRAHISNEFSRVMKIPVMTYIRYKKIIAAHQKILEGNVKINEVAYEYGFEEYSTFYRNYIKIIGKPPYSNTKKN